MRFWRSSRNCCGCLNSRTNNSPRHSSKRLGTVVAPPVSKPVCSAKIRLALQSQGGMRGYSSQNMSGGHDLCEMTGRCSANESGMKISGTNEWFRTILVCGEPSPVLPHGTDFAAAGRAAAALIRSPYARSLVRPGRPFYNPSNNASGAVVTLSSQSRADNRNTLNGCLSAGECLKTDFHLEFSQEH